jgi:hypothetical protein
MCLGFLARVLCPRDLVLFFCPVPEIPPGCCENKKCAKIEAFARNVLEETQAETQLSGTDVLATTVPAIRTNGRSPLAGIGAGSDVVGCSCSRSSVVAPRAWLAGKLNAAFSTHDIEHNIPAVKLAPTTLTNANLD